jgi:hypothetical protein
MSANSCKKTTLQSVESKKKLTRESSGNHQAKRRTKEGKNQSPIIVI